MKFVIKFKGIDHSQALCDYAEERLSRLEKFEIKPTRVNVTFSSVRFKKVAEIFVKGLKNSFRAKAFAEDFHEALSLVMDKLERQMVREKSKVKHHRSYERSNIARLEEFMRREREENMEHDDYWDRDKDAA